ncbi:MAG TPA: hypothetical protein VL069_05705 [Opitutus sp.]|nr:hypothetical protein [Opitutus sp.]
MNTAPVYAFSPRALRRWRDERLALVDEAGGRIQAKFVFEGTTCGSIPFQLIYTARLGSVEEDRRLLEMSCSPAPGDQGHQRMCAFLESADTLLRAMHSEQPLLGRPLAEALVWQPAISPAGCLCAASARNHKWLAVLHTLHFALEQRTLP